MRWFESVGIDLHPSLYLTDDPVTGMSFYTSSTLSKDTTVITVPSSICITPQVAHTHICELFKRLGSQGAPPQVEDMPRPDWILLYLTVCRIAQDSARDWVDCLQHIPYVAHIPTTIPAPLHFSQAELTLLQNTPLYYSTQDRLGETKVDFVRAADLLHKYLGSIDDGFVSEILRLFDSTLIQQAACDELFTDKLVIGLELWRWAESAFVSRAFPSRLIGLTESCPNATEASFFFPKEATNNTDTSASTPVLIPAYDMFNHARAHPVTWTHISTAVQDTTPVTTLQGKVAMTINYEITVADTQVFNNYGGKSNEEFLSGYGFTVLTTSEDTLALKLSSERDIQTTEPRNGVGQLQRAPQDKVFYWRSSKGLDKPRDEDSCPCPGLIQELANRLYDGRTDKAASALAQVERDVEVVEELETLLLAKRKMFRASQIRVDNILQDQPLLAHTSLDWSARSPSSGIRASVLDNIVQYRKGQLEIMNQAVAWTRRRLEILLDSLDSFSCSATSEA